MVTENWDIFDILFAHEDSYTNLMQYLFENSVEFYENFSRLLFNKVEKDLKYITRTAYITEQGKRNIPDIIIYNKNNFAMIEVKVYSGEGHDQTQRYYECKNEIKSKLEVNVNSYEKFYFLTLLGTIPQCSQFEAISWLEIGKCLPTEKLTTQEMDILVKHFKRRINSLSSKTISENDKWCDVVKTEYWGGARGLYDALRKVPSFSQLPDERCDYWGSFKKSKNKFTYSSLFLMKDSWKGCTVEEITCNPKNCYEYHFEFEWDEENRSLQMRLDYHLNPYMSKSEINSKSDENIKLFAQKSNEHRMKIAKEGKKYWKEYATKEWQDYYNARITENIMTLVSKTIIINIEDTVLQIAEGIEDFVKTASDFVDEIMLPMQNQV